MGAPAQAAVGAQAELEDLCFAVLQPQAYHSVRQQLDGLWGVPCLLGPEQPQSLPLAARPLAPAPQ